MKNRIIQLDFLRTIAIVFVVLIHCSEKIYPYNPNDLLEYSAISQFISIITLCIGRLGVPIFLFLTGYFNLSRMYNNEEIIVFYKNKVLPLIRITIVWYTIYFLFSINNLTPIKIIEFIECIFL